jgi:hypothetical protein
MNPGKATGIFFLLAVFFRILFIFLYPPSGTDHEMIHAAVDNLLSGNGLSFTTADPNDLSNILYQPMNEWPPLVAYMVSIAKAMTGNGYVADILLMSLGMFLLLLVLRSIMNLLSLGDNTKIFLWVLIAVNPEPFKSIGISDLYSGVFMLWGVLFCLRFFQMPSVQTGQLLVASVFFFLPAAFRYQYYPLIFIFPFFLMIIGKLKSQHHLFKSGFLSLSIVFCLLSFQLAFLYQHTGDAAHIADQYGFFPQNIQWTYPVLLKSFINISYLENKLVLIGKWVLNPYYLFNFVITALLISTCFVHLLRKLRMNFWNYELEKDSLYVSRLFLLSVSTAIILFLVCISLFYSPQISYGSVFTYAREDRYYLVCSLLLLVFFAKETESLRFFSRFSFSGIKRLGTTALLVINLMLFGKFLFNVATDNLKNIHERGLTEQQIIESEIFELKEKYKMPVVAVSSLKLFQYHPTISEYSVARTLSQINQKGLKTSQPVQLVLVTTPDMKEEERSFVKSKGATEIYNNERLRIFHLIVTQPSALASLY